MRALRWIVERRLGPVLDATPDGLCVILWDGTQLGRGTGPPRCTVTIRSPRVAWDLLTRPTALSLGECFIAGDLDVDGDIFAAMRAVQTISNDHSPRRRWRRRIAPRHDPGDAIAFHYDVSNDFYRLFLDDRMVYTCAYYPTPGASLDEAQRTKLDVVCRKLCLERGERFLDIGCGWGALVAWAAAHYGVRAHGVTLSRAQATWATDAIRRAGLTDRATVEYRDWRQLTAEPPWDAIAAVGLAEHLGPRGLPAFFSHVRTLLAPGGRFMNHAVTNRPESGWSDEMEFLARHVFPGSALTPAGAMQTALERSGFEVHDVENLRAHYARTTRTWATRLYASRTAARALVGERTYRTWLAYLAAASTAFEAGWIALHQIVATPVVDAVRWTAPVARPTLVAAGTAELADAS